MIPITHTGKNLGERHRHFNTLVNESCQRIDFNDILKLPEKSPIDRLFKINLASKIKNVDYIIENLKDPDMLYVSKALKCNWLLESNYEHIINPKCLEEQLFPELITTAVTKMKRWICLNLKEELRCQQFYQYYHINNFKFAIKFLFHCSKKFIEEEFPKIAHKISPHYFKIICEKYPLVAKTFFDSLSTEENLKTVYLNKEQDYFNTLRHLLKTNTELVLNITEKYFNKDKFKAFSPTATNIIMKNHKDRFLRKPELYTAWFLNIKTLAMCLNIEESKELIIKLARAKYLSTWFDYKKVEPFLKRLKVEDRAVFKKKIFVDKDIGEQIDKWPYDIPSSPILNQNSTSIFKDYEEDPNEYRNIGKMDFRSMLNKRKYARWEIDSGASKTMLDKLFDEYRFAGFDQTFFELRKKINAESSALVRQYMILVLVSKSGGHLDQLSTLMQLLVQHNNEPPQLRAAIIRSLVKRAQVWRLPEDIWKQLLEFSHGLGLDGKTPEIVCIEGVHAVVIRQLLVKGKCDNHILSTYLQNFSTLANYSLFSQEKTTIASLLPKILFRAACEENNVGVAIHFIDNLLITLKDYKLSIQSCTGLISKIESLAKIDLGAMSHVLKQLYKDKIARRELFKVNFEIMQTEDSYLNAIRHDIDILSPDKLIKGILSDNLKYQKFLKKVAIYFNEDDGLVCKFLCALKAECCNKYLAKPLIILIGKDLETFIKNGDSFLNDKIYGAALRANLHLARPVLNIDYFNWTAIGTKAIANKILICRGVDVNRYIEKLLINKRTIKLAMILAKRNSTFTDVINKAGNNRPTVTIKIGMKYLRKCEDCVDFKVWTLIKYFIKNLDVTVDSKIHLVNNLADIESIPIEIRPEYSVIIFNAFNKIKCYECIHILCHIENLLPNIDQQFVEKLLKDYLTQDFELAIRSKKFKDIKCTCLHLRMIVKYLLLSKSEDIQNQRMKSIGAIFFSKMEGIWNISVFKITFLEYLDELLRALKYTKAFVNVEYVSCLPVMEKVVDWMKSFLPIEEHFKKYAHIHLNMLYYKVIRKNLEKDSQAFIDKNKYEETVTLVGKTFGKYITREIDELEKKYFDSVIGLYKNSLLSYLDKYFVYRDSDFLESIILGMLDGSADTNILGVYLFKAKYSCLKEKSRRNIVNILKEKEELKTKLFVFSELFS